MFNNISEENLIIPYLVLNTLGKTILYSIISIFAYFTARYIIPKQSVFWRDVVFVGITTTTIIYLINRIIGISTLEFISTSVLFIFILSFIPFIILDYINIFILIFIIYLLVKNIFYNQKISEKDVVILVISVILFIITKLFLPSPLYSINFGRY